MFQTHFKLLNCDYHFVCLKNYRLSLSFFVNSNIIVFRIVKNYWMGQSLFVFDIANIPFLSRMRGFIIESLSYLNFLGKHLNLLQDSLAKLLNFKFVVENLLHLNYYLFFFAANKIILTIFISALNLNCSCPTAAFWYLLFSVFFTLLLFSFASNSIIKLLRAREFN